MPGGSAPQAAVDSDLASDMSDLDQEDIVDDLHLAEQTSPLPDLTRNASSDTLRTRNGQTVADSAPVVLRRASAQDQVVVRTQRAGSYHGSVHHSVTVSDFASLGSSTAKMGSLRSALASLAGRWTRSGRRSSAPAGGQPLLDGVEDGKTGCDGQHGLMQRIVARASCRLTRSKSGERGTRGAAERRGGARVVCGGGGARVTVSSASVQRRRCSDEHEAGRVMSPGQSTSTICDEQPLSQDDPQHHVPYIDDSDCEY